MVTSPKNVWNIDPLVVWFMFSHPTWAAFILATSVYYEDFFPLISHTTFNITPLALRAHVSASNYILFTPCLELDQSFVRALLCLLFCHFSLTCADFSRS